jgi:hypothetical protein
MDIFEDYETWYLDNTYGYQAPPKKEAMPMDSMPKEEPYVAKSRASMASDLEAKGIIASPAEAAQSVLVDAPVATVKGAVQGFLGLGGDIQMLLQGVYNMAANPEDKPKLQKFLDGLEKDTLLPTTEKIKQFVDDHSNYFKGLRNNPMQTVGEILAPGGYAKAIKAAKPLAKVSAPIAVEATGSINEKAK